MSLLGRTAFKTVAGKRFFSAAASPKVAIAQNLMLLREISGATDEAALTKIAAQGLPAVNIDSIPMELDELKTYFSLADLKSGDKFVADPNAWQNMGPLAYAGEELKRDDTWPFFVGFMSVLLLVAGLAAALPRNGEAHKNSKYMQMLEGRAHAHEEHAPAAAHH